MRKKIRIFQPKLSWLAIPFALIFIAYFVVPLILTLIVSFWDYTEYSIIPDFIWPPRVVTSDFSFEASIQEVIDIEEDGSINHWHITSDGRITKR